MNSFYNSKRNTSNLNTTSIIHCSPSKLSSSNLSFCSNRESQIQRDFFNNRNRNNTILFTPRSSALDYLDVNKSTEVDDTFPRKTRFEPYQTKFDPLPNLLFLGKKREFSILSQTKEITLDSIGKTRRPFEGLEILKNISMIFPSKDMDEIKSARKNKNTKQQINKKNEKINSKVEKKKPKQIDVTKNTLKSNITEKNNDKHKSKTKKKQKDVVKSIMNNILNSNIQVRTRSQYKKQNLFI